MFSKKKRIPRDQIKKVISEGTKSYSELFLIKKRKNKLSFNRYAFIVSKKVAKMAVSRVLIKRKVKSAVYKFDREQLKKTNTVNDNFGNDFLFIINAKIKVTKEPLIINELNKKMRFMVE